MSSESIRLSAEDKYSLVDMASSTNLFPHPFTLGNLGMAIAQLTGRWEFLWDFRNSGETVYNDIKDAYEEAHAWASNRKVVLAAPENLDCVRYALSQDDVRYIAMRPKPLPSHIFDLEAFADGGDFTPRIDHDNLIRELAANFEDSKYQADLDSLGMLDTEDELSEYSRAFLRDLEDNFDRIDVDEEIKVHEQISNERTRILSSFLDSIGVNSMLTELAFVFDRDRVKVIPYHSFSVHGVPIPRDKLILLRPGRFSSRYWRRFKKDILTLEELLNDPNVTEYEIEQLLRRNPLFLRGLNYRKVYSQVILPTGSDESLRPDLIAEPVDNEWCNIIDYKLPGQRVLVGRDNRISLAAGIHEVAAQLREYSAYFDDRAVARLVEEKYGFRCYRPKLVAIVGRDPQELEPEQVRRALTAYPNLEIVTYDHLLAAAKRYMLL